MSIGHEQDLSKVWFEDLTSSHFADTGSCILKYVFIWLCQVLGAALRTFSVSGTILHCGTWTLKLWLSGSVVVTCELSRASACRILVPQTGIKPMFPALQGRFLTTGPPGKFQYCIFHKFTVAPLHQASLLESFFQHHLLTLCLCRV